MKKILNKILNFKKQKKMIGKKVKIKPTPHGKKPSNNSYLGSSEIFTITNLYDKNAWNISFENGTNAGWVFEWEIIDFRCTIEELRDLHVEKYNEAKEIQAKIDWMEETGEEFFDEDEYKVYRTLKLLEDSETSIIEKSKMIAKLIKK